MLDEKKIEILKKKYNVPENELFEMGLLKAETVLLCGRDTKREHERLQATCYKNDILFASDIIRDYIINILEAKKIDKVGVIYVKSKKIKKRDESHISVRVDSKVARDFKKLCKKNRVSVASVLRYIVVMIAKEKGGYKV